MSKNKKLERLTLECITLAMDNLRVKINNASDEKTILKLSKSMVHLSKSYKIIKQVYK
jgi:hypothetical protein